MNKKIEKQIFSIVILSYTINKMNIPLDVLKIVASYLVKPKMKLLDWILLNKINRDTLSKNPNAIHLLEKNIDKINWWYLSENPNAIHLLEQNIDKIHWLNISKNPNIFEIDTKQLKLDITEKAKFIDDIIYE